MGKKRSVLGFRKGNAIVDTLTIIVVIFVFSIVLIFGKYVFDDVNADIQSNDDMTNSTKNTIQEVHTRSSTFLDGFFIFLFILIWALMIVASFMVDSHPVFLIFTVIIAIFVFFVAASLGNVYEDIADDPDLAPIVASDFPMTNWVMTHFLLMIVVMGFSVMISLFAKNRMGQQ